MSNFNQIEIKHILYLIIKYVNNAFKSILRCFKCLINKLIKGSDKMPKKATERQARYDKEHMVKYYLKLHKENDKDIINVIDPNNKQGSIKELIRSAINNK